MKYIKISILLLVLSLVGCWVYDSMPRYIGPGPHEKTTGNTEQDVHDEIDNFKNEYSVTGCIGHYKDIEYVIQHTAFSDDSSTNQSIVENLTNQAFSTYANCYATICKKYLRTNDWSYENLCTLKTECAAILASPIMATDAGIRVPYQEINDAIQQNDQMIEFLKSVDLISTVFTSHSDDFPDFSTLVTSSINNQSALSSSDYFNKCQNLKDQLQQVPSNLYQKHFQYLVNMIRQSTHHYYSYTRQSDYADYVYTPAKAKIVRLTNCTFYGKSSTDLSADYNSLIESLNAVNADAYDYYTEPSHVCQYNP